MANELLLRNGSVFTEAGRFEKKNLLLRDGKIHALLPERRRQIHTGSRWELQMT